MENVTKDYLKEQYKIAISDFKTARNENEQFKAREDMARIERLAIESYGFDFCDQIHELSKEIRK